MCNKDGKNQVRNLENLTSAVTKSVMAMTGVLPGPENQIWPSDFFFPKFCRRISKLQANPNQTHFPQKFGQI